MLILLYVFYKLSLSILPHWGVLFNVEIGYKNSTKNEILNSTTTFGGGIYSRTVKVYSFI